MLCLVTDRRRLGGQGLSEAALTRCVLTQIRQACEAGIDLVQVRERDLEAKALAALVSEAMTIARGTATRVVVNDRLDVALACGAHGVHLRAESIGIAEVRRIAPLPFVVGRSVHAVEDLAATAGADYLIAGTVFASDSKPEAHPQLGVDGLRAIVASAAAPVLAIGGISLDRVADVAAAGAAGIAAIGLFMRPGSESGPACRACGLDRVAAEARRRFDSSRFSSLT